MKKKNKYNVGQNVWYSDEERQLIAVATILDMFVIPHDYQSEPRYEIQYSVGNSKITRTEIVESELRPIHPEEQPNIINGHPGESEESLLARANEKWPPKNNQPDLGLINQNDFDEMAKKYKWMRDEFYTLSQSYWDVVKENISLKQKYETIIANYEH